MVSSAFAIGVALRPRASVPTITIPDLSDGVGALLLFPWCCSITGSWQMPQIFSFAAGLIRVPNLHILRHWHCFWSIQSLQSGLVAIVKEVIPWLKLCTLLFCPPRWLEDCFEESGNENVFASQWHHSHLKF
jgi:hypothetical protein